MNPHELSYEVYVYTSSENAPFSHGTTNSVHNAFSLDKTLTHQLPAAPCLTSFPQHPRPFPAEADTVAGSYAVYFNTLPVHLWGRRGEDGARHAPPIASAPARRLDHAWSQVTFVPGHAGELLFVQGWSNRVLLTSLPKVKPRQFASARSNPSGDAAGGRFGLLDGSRVVALDGHEGQASRGEGCS